MKLSNKILIGFFGFMFLYLTAVFAEIRLRGTPNIIDDSNSIAETVDISGVSYLVLQDLHNHVNVTASEDPRLEVRSLSGGVLQKLKYDVSGDTLTLSDLKSEDMQTVTISVFVPMSGLKGITVDSAGAIIKGLEQELLYILQNAAQIRMSDNKIGSIHTEASGGSHLNIYATDLDTLSANIEESQVLIAAPVKVLNGSMKNNSFLRVNDIGEIRIKKDVTSRLNVYQ